MKNESKKLKAMVRSKITNPNWIVIEEFTYLNHKYDMAIVDTSGYVIKVIECVTTQSLTNTLRKLINLPLNVDKAIVRYRKNRNPKAMKTIIQIVSSGIGFTEFDKPKDEMYT